MAFDRRKMKTAQEQEAIDASARRRRNMSSSERGAILTAVMGIAASSRVSSAETAIEYYRNKKRNS